MAFDSRAYVHESDKAALSALKAIPGFKQLVKAFMKVFSERQYRIVNLSSHIRISEKQFPEYYEMLPPICEKLGIDVPDLYLELNDNPNAFTAGDEKPFIVITSGLLNKLPQELLPTVLSHECGHIACHHQLYATMGRIVLSGASSAASAFLPFGSLLTIPMQVAFYYWMRCSEFSADRAAVLCDGTADKISTVCMYFAGYDNRIPMKPNKEEFMEQAREYREIVKNIKNTNEPNHPGTLIKNICEDESSIITGIAGKKDFLSFNISKDHMSNEVGFLRKALSVFEKYNVSIEHVPSGIDSFSVVVSEANVEKLKYDVVTDLKNELDATISVESNIALVAIVGRNMPFQ